MRYLHQVLDKEGNQIESVYSNRIDSRYSMECLAKIKGGVYEIWEGNKKIK